jgi:hypothetical protein
VKTLLVSAAAAAIPMAAQGQGYAKRCEVRLQSADAGSVLVFTGLNDSPQINWNLSQANSPTVTMVYFGSQTFAVEAPIEAKVELRLAYKDPGTKLTAVFVSKGRTWRIEMRAFDYGYRGRQDIRAVAEFNPHAPEISDLPKALASSDPIRLTVEANGEMIARGDFSANRLAARDALIQSARAKIARADPDVCQEGGPPPLVVPPPPARPLP